MFLQDSRLPTGYSIFRNLGGMSGTPDAGFILTKRVAQERKRLRFRMARFLPLPRSQEVINIDLIARLSISDSSSVDARFSVVIEFAGFGKRTEYDETDGQLILSEMGASVGMTAEQLADALRRQATPNGTPADTVDQDNRSE